MSSSWLIAGGSKGQGTASWYMHVLFSKYTLQRRVHGDKPCQIGLVNHFKVLCCTQSTPPDAALKKQTAKPMQGTICYACILHHLWFRPHFGWLHVFPPVRRQTSNASGCLLPPRHPCFHSQMHTHGSSYTGSSCLAHTGTSTRTLKLTRRPGESDLVRACPVTTVVPSLHIAHLPSDPSLL